MLEISFSALNDQFKVAFERNIPLAFFYYPILKYLNIISNLYWISNDRDARILKIPTSLTGHLTRLNKF